MTDLIPSIMRGPVAALCLAVLLPATVSTASAQGRPALVGVAKTERLLFTETVPVLGRLVAPTQAEIATRIAGIVDNVFVEVGNHVTEGDLIAKLNSELLEIQRQAAEASLAQSRAAIEVANANLSKTKQTLERAESLQESVAFSRARFEDLLKDEEAARGAVADAEAQMASARAALAQAAYNIRNTEIRAAVSGVVLVREAQPGEYLQIGSTIVTLLNDGDLEIETDVPTEVIGSVSPGQEIRVTLDDGTEHRAIVRALIPNESLSTRTRPVRLDPVFAGTEKPLAAGQSATIHVPVGAGRNVLTVPKDALVQARGGWIVYAAIDGKAQPRPVTIGAAVGDRFEVLSGLEPDLYVVIRGNERLRPGQDITFKEEEPDKDDQAAPSAEKSEGEAVRKTSGVGAAPRSGG
ncbi:MAG: efflux RND transporter periplasmic adaptor subunit [Pseudomonadota bacterium]